MNYHSTENGFCRVYYRGENKRLLCYQESFRGQFELFTCSKDGEPNHGIDPAPVHRDELPPTTTDTGCGLITWLEKEGLILESND